VPRLGRPDGAAEIRVNALVPGLEPLDEVAADADLWSLLHWIVSEIGGEWSGDDLGLTGRIYKLPGLLAPHVKHPSRTEPGFTESDG